MAELNLLLAGVCQWVTFGHERISLTLKVNLRILGKPMVAAIVEKQPVGNAGGGLRAGPDIESGPGHGWNSHPLACNIPVSDNHQGPRPSIESYILSANLIQLLGIHSS